MRRAATLGLLLVAGLGGGCAAFDDDECEHTAEYRRGGYQRDERPATTAEKPAPLEPGAGVYADR